MDDKDLESVEDLVKKWSLDDEYARGLILLFMFLLDQIGRTDQQSRR